VSGVARRVLSCLRFFSGVVVQGEGTVDTPLKDSKGYMQDALTCYVSVEHTPSTSFEWLTTVDLWPKTGRTHQLRRHMSGLGFPILGDRKYACSDHIVVRRVISPIIFVIIIFFSRPLCPS